MAEIKRNSPVRFDVSAVETEVRENWTVALKYENEGDGPWLVDLAHKVRWDLQDSGIGDMAVGDIPVPGEPGVCAFSGNTLVNRMNRTQASIYHLGATVPAFPGHSGYTDVSETTVFLALFGPKAFQVAEKLTSLDFLAPSKKEPFLLQGPFCHVPCQIVILEKSVNSRGGFLLTCSRGYGDSMVHAILKAGEEFNLRPAGENRFAGWIESLQGS